MATRRQYNRPKLTDRIVLRCRDRFRAGKDSMNALARHYGVTSPSMWAAVRGETYKHVPRAVRRRAPRSR